MQHVRKISHRHDTALPGGYLRVLVDDIMWDVAEGYDITALPMLDIIELNENEINDQDEFWAIAKETLETKHGTDCGGFRYQILDGTIH